MKHSGGKAIAAVPKNFLHGDCGGEYLALRIENGVFRPATSGQMQKFESQISNLKFQISDFRPQVADFRSQVAGFEFQISDFRFQISNLKFQISDLIPVPGQIPDSKKPAQASLPAVIQIAGR